ncbi:MAG: hypothetical protein JXB46_11100 [Candidatus Eisenbacteria bacterium]|nr:hypothetical protein [Candidatus Eisenbacteria bacterium]
MPYPREVAQDKVLNNIASYYGHEGCVYKEVAPIVDINHISGKYYVFGREELRVMNDTLGRRSHANELDWHVTTAQYRTVPRGLRSFIGQEDRENADPPIQLETTTTEKLIRALDLAAEVRLVAALDAAITATSNTAAGTDWSTGGTTGTPLTDIATAKRNFRRNCGVEPNAIVIPDDLADYMVLCDEWKENFTYTVGGDSRIAKYDALPPSILGMKPLVPKQLKLSGSPGVSDGLGPGGTPTLTGVWAGTKVYLLHINPRPSIMTATCAYTLTTTRQRTRRYDDESVGIGGGMWIQVEKQDVIKVVNAWMVRTITGLTG